MCGIVGIKPTVGLWSRSGIIPVSATQDTAGPMTRTVKDAAILLGVLCGVDEKDTLTKNSIGKNYSDYTKFLDANGLKGKRIGIDKSYMKKHEGVDDLVNMALKEMKKAGAEIVEIEPLLTDTTIGDAELAVLCFEFKDGLNPYLSESNSKLRSLKEIIEFNQQNETKSMPFFKQEIFEMSETKGNLKSQEYLTALKKTFTGSQSAIDASLKKYNLDAICELVAGPANCIDMVNGDYGIFYNSGVAAMAGYPHITVPAGMVFGLPVGLNFFGTAYSESTLISIGYAFEQASMKRAKPDFKNTFII
jgi:amidase